MGGPQLPVSEGKFQPDRDAFNNECQEDETILPLLVLRDSSFMNHDPGVLTSMVRF